MKQNLTQKKKSKLVPSIFRLPIELKEEAQAFAFKNKITLTEVVVRGIKEVIKIK